MQWNFDTKIKQEMTHNELVSFIMDELREGCEFTCGNPHVDNHGTSTYRRQKDGRYRAVYSDGNSSFFQIDILAQADLREDLNWIPSHDLRSGKIYYD